MPKHQLSELEFMQVEIDRLERELKEADAALNTWIELHTSMARVLARCQAVLGVIDIDVIRAAELRVRGGGD